MPTYTTTGTSISRLVQDEDIPNTNRDVVLRAIRRDESITGALLNAQVTSLSAKADKYFVYGRDHYHNGLPKNTERGFDVSSSGISTLDEIVNILSAMEGATVTLGDIDNLWTSINPTASAAHYMHMYYGYIPSTGVLDKYLIGYPDATNVTYVGAEFEIDRTLTLIISVDSIQHTLNVEPSYLDYDAIYFIVDYTVAGNSEVYTWTYAIESNQHPQWIITENTDLQYYPMVPVVLNGVSINKRLRTINPWEAVPVIDPFTTESVSGLALLNTLGLSGTDMAIKLEENPDFDSISDAYVMFCAPVNIDTTSMNKYFFLYWSYINTLPTHYTKSEFQSWISSGGGGNTWSISRTIKDIYNERGDGYPDINITIRYNWTDVRIVAGVIATEGSYTRLVSSASVHNGTNTISMTVVQYIHQHSATHYTIVEVSGLRKLSRVYVNATGRYANTYTSIDELGTATENNLYLPMARSILNQMFSHEQELLVNQSLSLVIQSEQSTHLAWYETPEFGLWVKVIGIVAAIVLWSPQIVAILEAGSLLAATLLVVELGIELLLVELLGEAFKLLVEEIGGELALYLTAILTLVALATGTIQGVDGLPFAKDLLQTVSMITDAINEVTLDDFALLQQEIEDFTTSSEQVQEDIEAAQALLDNDSGISIYDVVNSAPLFIAEESPDAFFNRTIHSGNVGVLSLDTIENYVANTLALPKI